MGKISEWIFNMNLYEYEGKNLFENSGITTPKRAIVMRGESGAEAFTDLGLPKVVAKIQILSGKRGKNGGIAFCETAEEAESTVTTFFEQPILNQYTAAVLLEEFLPIKEEHYLSITYNTNTKQPMLIYSASGGMDIEEVPKDQITLLNLDLRETPDFSSLGAVAEVAEKLWKCFLENDARQVEINPLVITEDGRMIAADAKVALDDDAFYRHDEWQAYPERTMMGRPPTDREVAVKAIDEGEGYYRGTAGKYIELDGTIAVLFSGGGASISNMDALDQVGLSPSNYTEYSGNPPREKVAALTKIVLSKPGIEGLWIAGGVANFTNIQETFLGIIDALDEVKPSYPIVVRRAGPFEQEGMSLMKECADRNGLNMKLFGKEVSMTETATELANMINN